MSLSIRLRKTASALLNPPTAWQRVAAAIVVAMLTVAISLESSRHTGVASYSLVVLGVVGVTWYMGLRTGLIFAVFAGAFSWIFVDEPRGQLSFKEASLIRLGIGMVTAIVVSYMLETTKRAKQSEAAMAESEARARGILDAAHDGILTIDEAGVVQSFNRAAERIFGYGAAEVIGRNINLLMPSPYEDEHDDYLRRYLNTGQAAIIGSAPDVRARRKDGTEFPIRLAVSEVLLPTGKLFMGVVQDLTERVKAEDQLRLSERRYHTLVEASTSIVWVADANAKVVEPQPEWERYTGQTWPDYRGEGFLDMVHPDDREGVMAGWQTALAERKSASWPARVWHAETRSWRYCDALAVPLKNEAGEVVEWIGTSHDVEDRYELQARELERMSMAALTDALTDLGNQRAFQEDLKLEVARATRRESILTLAVMDVDQLKETNDSHGHARGDEVLAEVGRLLTYLRGTDRAYRIGGDEFALLMPETSEVSAFAALDGVRTAIERSIEGVTVSIGLCTNEGGWASAEVLRDHADAAMYEAKRRGKNQVVSYAPSLPANADLTAARMQAVSQLISTDDPEMWFQPIFQLISRDLLAFEALLRLSEVPELDGAEQAFEVAARMGRSRDLDLVCTRRALDVARTLPGGVKIFINLAPATLMDATFSVHDYVRLAEERGVNQNSVVLEVTEKTIVPLPRLAERVRALQECGFAVALDDVGAGNSGLEMLRVVNFEYVKIDRSVIQDALNRGAGRAIILAIAAFAHETGATVIAEGIENKAMLAAIRLDNRQPFSIQAVQGYLFGQPEPSVERYLADASGKRASSASLEDRGHAA